jgi:anti-sigma factor RsiW
LDRICDRIEEYQEGQLTRDEKAEFEMHLESCPSCREELEWIRSLDLMFERVPVRRPPRSLERAVLSALGFGVKPAWVTTTGWAAASMVGVWLIALPVLIKAAGPKSIAPVARCLAGISSFITGLVNGLHVFVTLLRPAGVTAQALSKALCQGNIPLITLTVLIIGFAAGLGIWRNVREVRYVQVHT